MNTHLDKEIVNSIIQLGSNKDTMNL